ncbi:hypothetical protein HF576_12790 [Microbacterium sp. CFH 90308]|uniref:Integral membrane protein n=1 Tax=Microbacterium salsuginis TaxID=2722803 RepID=A0ABX1KE02_9MICO|nr:hypothetical protein [Microbacterium sp. CFH 90308]NLP84727.1 hypothetical protein [Microbacterium sp. CFH 90308]
MKRREWVLLGAVTGAVLLALAWAARMPAVCAAALPCSHDSRLLPAMLGAIVVALLAIATAVLAHASRERVTEGVRRSEGLVALGVTVIAVVGVASVAATLFSAGFALRL